MCAVENNVGRSLAHWLHQAQRLQSNCGSIKVKSSIKDNLAMNSSNLYLKLFVYGNILVKKR